MKIQPYFEKLNISSEYKKFIKKYSDAFLVAGFFILDMEMGKNVHQIDFYIPSEKKFAAFTLDEGVNVQILDTIVDKIPEKLDINTKIDLDALQGILEDEMKNRNITEEIKKIIAVVQNVNGKKIWNINSILSGMDILKAHIEDDSKTVLKMEKTSFTEIMKKIPMAQIQQMQQAGLPQVSGEEKLEMPPNENAEDQIKKLDQLEAAIEKEKQRLKKTASQAPAKKEKKVVKKAKNNHQ